MAKAQGAAITEADIKEDASICRRQIYILTSSIYSSFFFLQAEHRH